MGARLTAALLAGRAAAAISRRLGLGGGTVLPGHLVPRIEPRALRTIVARLPEGTVFVSGTNGKTTTSRLISAVLQAAGLRPLHNRAGANLLTGLVAAVVHSTDLRGVPRADVGVFEVDEATLPLALQHADPRVVVLTNLFRDQLDRYGEIAYVASLWEDALRQLPAAATVVLNADDPMLAALAERTAARVVTYGVEDRRVAEAESPHAVDARLCPCGAPLRYSGYLYGHVGYYSCPRCGRERPRPAVRAVAVHPLGTEGTDLAIETPAGHVEVRFPLPGLYNVSNALAAVATAEALGLPVDAVARGLSSVHAAFGRLERVAVGGRKLFLALVKNPVGFNEVLRTLLGTSGALSLLIVINDRLADGTDISWLWDVDFELLAGRVETVVCSGIRAHDMALRLKYALVDTERIVVEEDVPRALDLALGRLPEGATLFVLPTYTAMLEVRQHLANRGLVRRFWED